MLPCLLLATLLLTAAPAMAGELLAHRASYLLSMGHSQSGSDVVDVQGVMVYEFTDACDGWTTTQKARIQFYYDDGRRSEVGWSLNSWESKDGKHYRFFMRNLDGDTVTSSFKGEATIAAAGQPGTVQFEEPKGKTVTLPPGTLFPTGHTLALLRHLGAGDPTYLATVFDGSDDKGPIEISAALAGRGQPAADETKLSPLLTGPTYRLSLAFYAPAGESNGGDESTPQQEQSVSLYANGVIDKLTMDYGSFTVDAALKKLEPLPAPGC
jgi:EipB-like